MITAVDIMTPNASTLSESTRPEEAFQLFVSKKITAIPVLKSTGEVAGILTELVMIRIIIEHRQKQIPQTLADFSALFYPEKTVLRDATIDKIIKAMVASPTQRVVVKDLGANILGVISPKDILKLLASARAAEAS